MSTDPHSVARGLTDLYGIVIHQNPEACSTCHQRIRDRTEHDPDQTHDGLGTGNHPTETLVRAGVGELGYDVEIKDEYGARRHYRTRTYCGECGRPTGTTDDDPPTRRQMLARVPALQDRLDDHGLAATESTFRRVIHHARSVPKYDSRTDDIWAVATALAVRDAYQ